MSTLSEHWIQDYYDLQEMLLDAGLITASSGTRDDTPTISGTTVGDESTVYITNHTSNKFYDITTVSGNGEASIDGATITYISTGYGVINIYSIAIDKMLSLPAQWLHIVAQVYGMDQNTVLLLHMDADDGDTGHIITFNGNPYFDSTEKKFGTSSLYFDGTGDYLSPASSGDFAFGSGSFTVDFWINVPSSEIHHSFFDSRTTGYDTSGFAFYYHYVAQELKVWEDGEIFGGSYTIDTDTWIHIALSYDGSDIRVFVDGTQVGSTTSHSFSLTNQQIRIGSAFDGSYYLQGYLDEYSISKGIARWTSNFIPPTTPHTSDSDTKLLLHMNGGDTSFKNHNVTAYNVKTNHSTKKFGTGAMYFDGSGDYLSMSDSVDWDFGTGDFTIDFWSYMTSNNTDGGIVSASETGTPNIGWLVATDSTTGNKFRFVSDGSGSFAEDLLSNSVTLNQWNHVAFVRNGNDLRVYINGTSDGNVDCTGYTFNGKGLVIGREFIDHAADYYYKDYLDEIRVSKGIARWTSNFNVAGSEYSTENDYETGGIDEYTVLMLHMDGIDDGISFIDSSISGTSSPYSITRNGALTKITTKKFGTASGYFDGSDDYLEIPDSSDWNFGSGNFTIDFWARMNTATGEHMVISFGKSDGSNVMFGVRVTTAGFTFRWRDSSPAWYSEDFSASTIDNNEWHHVAVVRNGNNILGFFDGTKIKETGFTFTLTPTGDVAYVGRRHGSAVFEDYKDYLDELRVSKGIARWTDDFTPPNSPYTLASETIYGNDSYTKLLLHGDNPHDSTTFTDSSNGSHNITRYGALIKTTQKKFGHSSMYFDGSDDYLEAATSSDWQFGSGDFTIDCFVRLSDVDKNYCFVSQHNGNSGNRSWGFYFDYFNDQIYFTYYHSVGTSVRKNFSWTPVVNTWYHLAIVRSTNDLMVFVDGTQIGSTESITQSLDVVSESLRVGVSIDGAGDPSNDMHGYIDELRVSKGIARWTSVFTPPTRAYQ